MCVQGTLAAPRMHASRAVEFALPRSSQENAALVAGSGFAHCGRAGAEAACRMRMLLPPRRTIQFWPGPGRGRGCDDAADVATGAKTPSPRGRGPSEHPLFPTQRTLPLLPTHTHSTPSCRNCFTTRLAPPPRYSPQYKQQQPPSRPSSRGLVLGSTPLPSRRPSQNTRGRSAALSPTTAPPPQQGLDGAGRRCRHDGVYYCRLSPPRAVALLTSRGQLTKMPSSSSPPLSTPHSSSALLQLLHLGCTALVAVLAAWLLHALGHRW